MAERILEQQRNQGFIKDKTRSWIGGARLLVPILVLLICRVITAAQRREHLVVAQRFGASADDAAHYQGYGAPLLARIEATRDSLTELRKLGTKSTDGLTRDTNSRLDVMANATSAAEKVTPEQHRRAHHSITAELGLLDRQIISELGV